MSKRKKRISFFKKSLIAIFFGLIFITLFYQSNDNKTNLSKTEPSKEESISYKPEIDNVKFISADKENFYQIESEKIIENETGIFDLFQIIANLSLDENRKIIIFSDTGKYFKQAEVLHLNDNINIFLFDGYEMLTQIAKIYLKDEVILGDLPSEIQGPMGFLTANKFIITEKGEKIRFYNDVALDSYNKDDEKEINITAKELILFPEKDNAIFQKNVVITENKSVIESEEVKVNFAKKDKDTKETKNENGQNGKISEIIFDKPLEINSETKNITADKGYYNAKTAKIILNDNVILKENDSILKGERLVYDVKKDKAQITGKKSDENNNRVRGTLKRLKKD